MEVSCRGIIQTEGLEVPFIRFIGIIAPGNMAPFESNAHLVYVDILTTDEVKLIAMAKMIEIWTNSPKGIILVLLFKLGLRKCTWVDNMKDSLESFESITSKTFFYEGVGVARISTPIGPHSRLTLHTHVQEDSKETI